MTYVQLIAVSWRHGNKLYVIRKTLCVTYVYSLSLSKCYDNFCAQTLKCLKCQINNYGAKIYFVQVYSKRKIFNYLIYIYVHAEFWNKIFWIETIKMDFMRKVVQVNRCSLDCAFAFPSKFLFNYVNCYGIYLRLLK